MKKQLLIVGVVIILLIFSLLILNKGKNKVQYETTKLGKNTIVQVVEASGTINPVTTVNIGSQVSGLIKEIYVNVRKKFLYNTVKKTSQKSALEHSTQKKKIL